MCVCFLACAYVCVYCFLGDVWEGVGQSNIRVTGRVSSCRSLLNPKPLGFFRGGGMQGLVGDESTHQMHHVSPDQPITIHQKILFIVGFQPVDGSHYTQLKRNM